MQGSSVRLLSSVDAEGAWCAAEGHQQPRLRASCVARLMLITVMCGTPSGAAWYLRTSTRRISMSIACFHQDQAAKVRSYCHAACCCASCSAAHLLPFSRLVHPRAAQVCCADLSICYRLAQSHRSSSSSSSSTCGSQRRRCSRPPAQ